MSEIFVLLGLVILGALANRHRGGWLGTGHTQVARLDFAFAVTLMFCLAWFAPLPWQLPPALFVATCLGTLIGHGQDMGDDTPQKAIGLAASGTGNAAGFLLAGWWLALGQPHDLAALHLAWHPQFWALPIVMAGKPLAYFLGKYLPPVETLLGQGFARGSTEWGEALFGAAIGLAIWVVT